MFGFKQSVALVEEPELAAASEAARGQGLSSLPAGSGPALGSADLQIASAYPFRTHEELERAIQRNYNDTNARPLVRAVYGPGLDEAARAEAEKVLAIPFVYDNDPNMHERRLAHQKTEYAAMSKFLEASGVEHIHYEQNGYPMITILPSARSDLNRVALEAYEATGSIVNLQSSYLTHFYSCSNIVELGDQDRVCLWQCEALREAVQEAKIHSVKKALDSKDVELACSLYRKHGLNAAEVSEACRENFSDLMKYGKYEDVETLRKTFGLEDENIKAIALRVAQNALRVHCLNDITCAAEIAKVYGLERSELLPKIVAAVESGIKNSSPRTVAALVETFGFSKDEIGWSSPLLRAMMVNLELADVSAFAKFARDNEALASWLLKEQKETLLTKDLLRVCDNLHITPFEGEQLLQAGTDLGDILAKKDFAGLFEALKRACKEWQDEAHVSGPFERGAAVFGHARMLAFADRPKLRRHDAFHQFDDVLTVHAASGISAAEFDRAILRQVCMDGAGYSGGAAHHHFNSVVHNLKLNLDEMLERARRYPDIRALQELASSFENKQAIFRSWSSLKRFAEFSDVLDRTQILDELQQLRKEGKLALYSYVETLAFHTASRVSLPAVIQFWRETGRFLGLADGNSDTNLHASKKPSNYVQIPHLDLTAEELRDALVEGRLDEIQVFTPFEARYEISESPRASEATRLREGLRAALGSRRENVPGHAKNVNKLFHTARRLADAAGIGLPEYLQGRDLPDSALPALAEALYDPAIGIPRPPEPKSSTLIAKINLKSDPLAALAGNDTACCMPFGSGKNNVYTFNPNCALFTLQVLDQQGQPRTVAQSVLTKDAEIGVKIPELLKELMADKPLANVDRGKLLLEALKHLACDNVEIAPRFKEPEWVDAIEHVYRDFFSLYMERYAERENLDARSVPIGLSFSDGLNKLPKITNTFAPQAPVAYSDKYGEDVALLDLARPGGAAVTDKILRVGVSDTAGRLAGKAPALGRGVKPLTFEDTLGVAYMESLIYSDNPSLTVELHNIENALIAKDINNAAKGRPNLSLQYRVDGELKGYMLAYEGRYEAKRADALLEDGSEAVYVADLAAAKDSLAGGRLVNSFVELMKREYLENGRLTPIYAEFREKTSYNLLKRKIERIGSELGLEVVMKEGETYEQGGDTMHPVAISFGRAAETA